MISIIVPTIPGREHHLKRCEAAYAERTVNEHELIVVQGSDCCGVGWNAGVELATGEYLHFSADDLEPAFGWDTAAVETCEAGKVPAPVTLQPDGRIESMGGEWGKLRPDWAQCVSTCVVPFIGAADWRSNVGPSLQCHYYTDNWFTDQCRRAGLEIVIRHAYAFVHHWAKEGRGDEDARKEADRAIYAEATMAVELAGL